MNSGSDERKLCYEVARRKASVYTIPAVGIDSSFSFLREDLGKTLCNILKVTRLYVGLMVIYVDEVL